MSKTEVSGKQVKDGSIELVDLGTTVVDALNSKASASSLSAVATSGSYNDLSDKPVIPSLTQVESDIAALQSADIALDARLDVLEAGGTGGGSGSVYISPSQPMVYNTTYTITHNLGIIPSNVQVVLTNTSSGAKFILPDFYVSGGSYYGFDCINVTNTEFTLRTYQDSGYGPCTFEVYVTGGAGGSGASYEIAEFTHPEQAGTSALYTITHNLNTLFPIVELQMLNFPAGTSPSTGWSVEPSWLSVPSQQDIGGSWWHGAGFHVVDANTIKLEIWRLAGGPVQIRGKVFAGGTGTADLTSVNNSITALDGRVDALEAVVPFSGSYNDLSNKPTIPSLTQVESDISALQSADVVFDTRVDALEAADVALDARLDTAEATLISLDNRVDSLEASGGSSGGGSAASYVAPYSTEITHTGTDSGVEYVIAHNLGTQNINVIVYCIDESTGKEFIQSNLFSYYSQNFGYYVLEKTANSFTLRMFRWDPLLAGGSTGTYKARVVVSAVGAPASSGAIEVFQDDQFNWSGSLERTITHNKGRQPDLVQVFVQRADLGSTLWVQHYDLNGSYGWDSIAPANNNNATLVRLFANNNGTTFPTRIRLYWFGSNDVGTASAGSFSVGGASSSKRFVSQEFQHTSNNNGTVYAVPHNFGDFPDYIGVQLKVGDVWVNHNSFYYVNAAGGISYGFAATETSTINTAQVKVYYLRYDLGASPGGTDVASGTIRFVCGRF